MTLSAQKSRRTSAPGPRIAKRSTKRSQEKQLLDRLFSSEVKCALLVLFHRNPGIVDTTAGVARRIGRMGEDIEIDLNELVTLGILLRIKLDKIELFQFDRSRDGEIMGSVAKHMENFR